MAKLRIWDAEDGVIEHDAPCIGGVWGYLFTETMDECHQEVRRTGTRPHVTAQLLAGISLHNWDTPGKVEAYENGKVVAWVEVADTYDGKNSCGLKHDVEPDDSSVFPS